MNFDLTIIVCTYKREKEIKRLVESIVNNCNSSKIKLVIFNNDAQNKLHFMSTDNVKIEVHNESVNKGKIFYSLNYIKKNYHTLSKYVMFMDDKDFFTSNIDLIINDIKQKNKNFYTLNLSYINHPWNIHNNAKFNEGETMIDFYFRNKNSNPTDRLWIVSKEILKNIKIRSYYEKEVGINAFPMNRYYYKEPCYLILEDKPLATREYVKKGASITKNKGVNILIDLNPNCYLEETWGFVFIKPNIKNKILQIIEYNKTYKEIKKSNKVIVFRFKLFNFIIQPILLICKIIKLFK